MKPDQVRRLRNRGIRGMQEGGFVFGPDEVRNRGGRENVGAVPGYSDINDPRYITNETLEGIRSGSLTQSSDDPYDIYRTDRDAPKAITPPPPMRDNAGVVFDDPLPLGIRKLQAGRSLGAPRGQLLRTAGIALPSAQARRRMLPGEREAFQGLGRMAGIPEGEFQQELGITNPSGARRTGSARMLPLSLRR